MTATVQPRSAFHTRLGRLLGMAVHPPLPAIPAVPATAPAARCFLTADVNGHPARVCEISNDGARVELSVPVALDDVTFTLVSDGHTLRRYARVVSYRRHPDGPASYGLEFTTA